MTEASYIGETMQLEHEDTGSGAPTMVFIHGLCCDQTDWRPQVDRFAGSHRVIAVTLRGHGGQPAGPGNDASTLAMEQLAADAVALLRKKGITSAIVAGHSMGTRVVHEMLAQAPDIVDGIVLVDGSDSAFGDLAPALRTFGEATSGSKLKAWLQGLFEAMFYGNEQAELRDACVARALRMPDENVRQLYTHMMRWDATKADGIMRAIDVPTLVIQSTTRGPDGSRRALNEGEMGHYPGVVQARNRNASFALLPGHGHFTMLEAPDWTYDAIASWMRDARLPR